MELSSLLFTITDWYGEQMVLDGGRIVSDFDARLSPLDSRHCHFSRLNLTHLRLSSNRNPECSRRW
jgi:hypothetical protein